MTDEGALEAVDRVLNRGGVGEEVLAAVLRALVERRVVTWASVAGGPSVGGEPPADTQVWPVRRGGREVGRLLTSPGGDADTLRRVALQLSPYCTGG